MSGVTTVRVVDGVTKVIGSSDVGPIGPPGSLTLHQANVGLSAGGADPITNLGAGGAVFTSDDAVPAGPWVFTLDGTDLVTIDAVGNISILAGDGSVAMLGYAELALNDASAVARAVLRADGAGLVIKDSSGNTLATVAEAGFTASDGFVDRLTAKADGSGLTLYDEFGDQVAQFSEDSASLKKASVHLLAADILTLDSVPFRLVAAQGAGTVVMPHAVFSQTIVGAVPFDDPATPDVVYGSDTNPLNTNSQIDIGGIVSDSTGLSTQFSRNSDVMENAALNLLNLGAPASPANGDTTIWITVYYTVETLH